MNNKLGCHLLLVELGSQKLPTILALKTLEINLDEEVREILEEALASDDIRRLEGALVQMSSLISGSVKFLPDPVTLELEAKVKKSIDDKKAVIQAKKALQAAMVECSIERIQETLTAAKSMSVDPAIVSEAEALLGRLENERRVLLRK